MEKKETVVSKVKPSADKHGYRHAVNVAMQTYNISKEAASAIVDLSCRGLAGIAREYA